VAAIKDILQRIDNVGTTRQIMNAMDMISSSKLQRARVRLEHSRTMLSEARRITDSVTNSESAASNIYIKGREVKNTAYIVITSDKGLCGSYNIAVAQEALNHMKDKNEQILVIGSKGNDFFKRRNKNIRSRIANLPEANMYEETRLVSGLAMSLYVSGEVDEVYVAYTQFASTLQYIPQVEKLLPLHSRQDGKSDSQMTYQPDINNFIDYSIPVYLHTYLYALMAESIASEHASRMINMSAAEKNASEIIDDLKLMYNRKRQAAITNELSEIIAGVSITR